MAVGWVSKTGWLNHEGNCQLQFYMPLKEYCGRVFWHNTQLIWSRIWNCRLTDPNIVAKVNRDHWLLYVPARLTFTNSTSCPHSVFMCFVWISEQTAIISLYNINWLVCRTETGCLLRGTNWVFKAQWLLYVPTRLTFNKFYVLPTQCIYVFCVDLRTNSNYFTVQH
jgi:hypothetical protein